MKGPGTFEYRIIPRPYAKSKYSKGIFGRVSMAKQSEARPVPPLIDPPVGALYNQSCAGCQRALGSAS